MCSASLHVLYVLSFYLVHILSHFTVTSYLFNLSAFAGLPYGCKSNKYKSI